MEKVISIAGSDPSAGAGVQQDLKTITALGCYGMTVITALTSQNTMGVQGVMPVPGPVVESQIRSLFEDIAPDAIKIGQVPDSQVANVIADALSERFMSGSVSCPVVYDPVMISTSGHRLMADDAVSVVISRIFPLCTLITPNIPEAEYLVGHSLKDEKAIIDAGRELVKRFGTNILIKGGHSDGDAMTDNLFMTGGEYRQYSSFKIDSSNLHGTGCCLSSAIASGLAKGHGLEQSVLLAKDYVTRCIKGGRNLGIGQGNGPIYYV